MSAPLQSGDTAVVVNGMGAAKSPNVGKTVKVLSLQGEHSRLGRVWRCEGAGIQQLSDGGSYVTTGWADFPAAWLQKLDPPLPVATTDTTNEVTT